ncbi:MAG: AraC family transcriptional regulator [Bacteroidetes bacterium]|jgi:AraC family transcriptional regulator|nr:AraC family transcriptional regulator [Bacteroidota bacterium]
MQQVTSAYYQQTGCDVKNYIYNHLSDELNVKHLSEQFGISFFHFQRIMKDYLNEPLGKFINRVRLETALKIIRYTDLPLSEIALQIGYSDCSAFSKAFSKKFGFSPQRFKSNNLIALNTHVDFKINNSGKLVNDIKPKIVIFADKPIVYTKFKGEYTGKEYNNTWDNFWEVVIRNNILSWKPDVFSAYYDNPFETDPTDCKAECCVATHKKASNSEQIETKTLAGGKYAMFRYKGPHKMLLKINEYILKKWVISSNLKLRNSPLIEKYINNYRFIDPPSLLTEIYIPIE